MRSKNSYGSDEKGYFFSSMADGILGSGGSRRPKTTDGQPTKSAVLGLYQLPLSQKGTRRAKPTNQLSYGFSIRTDIQGPLSKTFTP